MQPRKLVHLEYENSEMCSHCGGDCCKRMPGSYVPTDFVGGVTRERVESLLDQERVQIEYSGDFYDRIRGRWIKTITDGFHYLRPMVIGETVFGKKTQGICVHHSPDGCTLELTTRPYGCRVLIPSFDFETGMHQCTNTSAPFGMKELEASWCDHQDMLAQIRDKYL